MEIRVDRGDVRHSLEAMSKYRNARNKAETRMDNGETRTMGRRGNSRGPTEPHGTPTGGKYPLKSNFFRFFGAFYPLDPPPAHSQIPNASVVSKRLV